jgi:putative intracellular protease/amidase
MTAVLLVLTGSDHWTFADGEKHPSGYWPEEFVVSHRLLREQGLDVTVATPGGVPATADELGFTPEMNGGDPAKAQELRDYIASVRAELDAPAMLEDLDPRAYDAIVLPGGHGPMEDLAVNEDLGKLVTRLHEDGKLIAAVCHGPAGLLPARKTDGTWLFAGHRVTGFTNEEEQQVGFAPRATWLLEARLEDMGADFEGGPAWEPKVVVDRQLVTGQNPASTEPFTRKVVELLQHNG